MKAFLMLISCLLTSLCAYCADKNFFFHNQTMPIYGSILNNCLNEDLQIRTPVDYNYVAELASKGSLYLIIKSTKIINIPHEEENINDLSKLNFLENQKIFEAKYKPTILFHHIKNLNKTYSDNSFTTDQKLCIWPNIACQISKAIIGFFPVDHRQSFEIEEDKKIPISSVDLVYNNKDIRSFDLDFNKLYGYEIVKNEKVSNFFISQFLQIELENIYLKELKIHFFSRTTYEDQASVAEVITTEVHKSQDPNFIPSISPYLLELENQDIYICRSRR